jgi:hypothetical protein
LLGSQWEDWWLLLLSLHCWFSFGGCRTRGRTVSLESQESCTSKPIGTPLEEGVNWRYRNSHSQFCVEELFAGLFLLPELNGSRIFFPEWTPNSRLRLDVWKCNCESSVFLFRTRVNTGRST